MWLEELHMWLYIAALQRVLSPLSLVFLKSSFVLDNAKHMPFKMYQPNSDYATMRKALVLLHGWMGHKLEWDTVCPLLAWDMGAKIGVFSPLTFFQGMVLHFLKQPVILPVSCGWMPMHGKQFLQLACYLFYDCLPTYHW